MEILRYSQLGREDIRFGKGTFEARLANGQVVTLQEVDLGAILADSDLSTPALSYLTGSWTPSVGGNATYLSQLGTYTKIGNVVTVNCRLVINIIGTGSQTVMTGLPYPARSTYYVTFPLFFANSASSIVYAVAYVDPAVPSSVRMGSLTAAGTSLGLNALMGDGTFVCFSGSYLTDD